MTLVLIGKGLVLGGWPGFQVYETQTLDFLCRKLPSHSCEGIAVIVFHQLQDGDHITGLHLDGSVTHVPWIA